MGVSPPGGGGSLVCGVGCGLSRDGRVQEACGVGFWRMVWLMILMSENAKDVA